MTIKTIRAREILNSSGTTSLEVKVILEDGSVGRASVPFGVSAGSYEAFVLFDGGSRYAGKGMQKAVANVNGEIAEALIGKDAMDQVLVDKTMIALDGTENKKRLGANAILGVSLAVARAAAKSQGLELWEYIRRIKNYELRIKNDLPSPMIVVIEGGKHADDSTDFQEYLIVPQIRLPGTAGVPGTLSIKESVRAGAEVYLELKKALKEHGLNTNVGNEGAYAPNGIQTNEEPWEFIMEAIVRAGYTPGKDIFLAADPACSEIVSSEHSILTYKLARENRTLLSGDLIDYFENWVKKYPFITLEDILAEDDWKNWTKATARIGDKVRVIGDDLLVTNPTRLKRAIEEKACNAILIKLNQIGTLTETIQTMEMAQNAGFWTIVSHRGGGETNDASMIDLAVAMQSQMVKVGICRGERVAKYNRLMEIEETLSNF